jgi:hypothetical protein
VDLKDSLKQRSASKMLDAYLKAVRVDELSEIIQTIT